VVGGWVSASGMGLKRLGLVIHEPEGGGVGVASEKIGRKEDVGPGCMFP
jgi:hypothetical protein